MFCIQNIFKSFFYTLTYPKCLFILDNMFIDIILAIHNLPQKIIVFNIYMPFYSSCLNAFYTHYMNQISHQNVNAYEFLDNMVSENLICVFHTCEDVHQNACTIECCFIYLLLFVQYEQRSHL